MTYPVRRGYVYQVDDKLLRLPPEDERTVYTGRRPFLVLSGDATNSDSEWSVVSGFPISTSPKYKTEFDVELGPGEGGLASAGWVRIHALQPLLKTDLQDWTGMRLESNRLVEIEAQLFRFLEALN